MCCVRGVLERRIWRGQLSVQDGPSKIFFEMMNMGCFEVKLVEVLPSDFSGCFSVPILPWF